MTTIDGLTLERSILVTGGAGFIGSCFVRQWITQDRGPVVILDKLTYAGNLDSLGPVLDNPRHVVVEGDIVDRRLVARLLDEHRPWAIMHLAAESHVDRSIDAPAPFVQTNVVGTFQLLEAAREYWQKLPTDEQAQFRFLHVSTDEVHGSLGSVGRFKEESQYAPNSPYAASKAAADHFARAAHRTYGLPVITTNCSNNYGPYQYPEKLIPLMILNCLEGRPLPVYGDGRHVRDWLFVEDHCEALRTVLDAGRPGEVYHLGGGCEMANVDLVRAICHAVDRLRPDLPHAPCEALVTFVEDRRGHDRRYAIDAAKVRRELGWRPREDFDSGLEKTVLWYLDNPGWVERVTRGVYGRERLGVAGRG